MQQVSQTVKKQYRAIDLMRLICALLVICVHVYPLQSVNQTANFILVHAIARIAVPFFCVTSGFFLFGKIVPKAKTPDEKRSNRKRILTYSGRILLLYVLWSLIYLPASVGLVTSNGLKFNWGQYLSQATYYTTYLHLWYLPALLLGALLTYWLIQVISVHKVVLISAVLYVVGLFGDSWFGFLKGSPALTKMMQDYLKIFKTTRNGLFFAFFFVALGALFAQANIRLPKRVTGPATLAGFALLIFEALMLQKYKICIEYNLYLSLIPLSFFLFAWLKEVSLKDRAVYPILRDMSLLMYCSHELVRFYVPRLLRSLRWMDLYQMYMKNSLLSFGVVVVGAAVLSGLVLFLVRVCKIKILKVLY